MSKLSAPLRVLALVAVTGTLVAVALGAGGRELTISGGDIRGFIVPAAQIIDFDNTAGMLDTATGAIYRLRGNLDNPSAKTSWLMRVPPVNETTSGLLEIQRPVFNPNAIFLVDIVTGKTWLLRNRASTNRQWMPVEIHRSSQFH